VSARQKLNVAFFNGSILIAGLAGLATQSWHIFLIVLLVSLVGQAYCRELR